jgi:signal peptidase II
MQAARGTSLSHDDSSLNVTSTVPSRARVRTVLAGVFLLAYALDQATKWLAVDRLTGHPDKHVVGDLLILNLTRNAGAAFSTGTGYTELLSLLAVVAALAVVSLARRLGSAWWAVAFGLLLAGICGNLPDRLVRAPSILRGQVVDFLQLPHWPIFNVADICINVAAAMILVQALRGVRLDGTRAVRGQDRSGTPES